MFHSDRIRTTRSWLDRPESREDLFTKKQCATWLMRHMDQVPALEEQDLSLAFWVLGQRVKEILDKLVPILDSVGLSAKDKRSLQKLDTAPEDLGSGVLTLLSDAPHSAGAKFLRLLTQELTGFTRKPLEGAPSQLEKNLEAFGRMFDLSDQEMELCLVFYLIKTRKEADYWLDGHLNVDMLHGRQNLARILGLDMHVLNRLLNGGLTRIGIISEYSSLSFDSDFLPFLMDPSGEVSPDRLYRRALAPEIPLSYHLVRPETVAHLKALLAQKRPTPCHVLLYGPPGTGKTSFARALVQELDAIAYEVVRPATGRDNAGTSRASLMGCLNTTNRGQGAIIIADEADNLLNTTHSWHMRGESHDKGWLNQLMDEPEVRMIWITNSVNGLEDSVRRRFAFSLNFHDFNRLQRMQLWQQVLRRHRVKRLFNAQDIERLASEHQISAGVMDLAVRKTVECYPHTRRRLWDGLMLGLEAHLTLAGDGVRPLRKDGIESEYSLEGLNLKGDIQALLSHTTAYSEALHQQPDQVNMSMNLLFYGPPGTGKSELARFLAQHLDRELLVRRASDLLDPYVGMSERNLAEAFSEAEAQGAVLVIDEADSMLFNRDRARRSWEISLTNEFLTQMERFRGILVCTTNRLTDLDAASVRRFQEKVQFDFLTPDGNVIFYGRLLARLASGPLDAASEAYLRRLTHLTPGDFRVVRDRNVLRSTPRPRHGELVAQLALEAEIKLSQHGETKVGF